MSATKLDTPDDGVTFTLLPRAHVCIGCMAMWEGEAGIRCPSCGRPFPVHNASDATLTVTKVDRDRGMVTVSSKP